LEEETLLSKKTLFGNMGPERTACPPAKRTALSPIREEGLQRQIRGGSPDMKKHESASGTQGKEGSASGKVLIS